MKKIKYLITSIFIIGLVFLPELWIYILAFLTILSSLLERSSSQVSYLFQWIYNRQKSKLIKYSRFTEDRKFILLFNEIGIAGEGLFSNALLILTEHNIQIYKSSFFSKVTKKYKYSDVKDFSFREGWLGNDATLEIAGGKKISLIYNEIGDYHGALQYLDEKISKKNFNIKTLDIKENSILKIFMRSLISFLRMTLFLPLRWLGFHLKNPMVLGTIGGALGLFITVMPPEYYPILWNILKSYTPLAIIFWLVSNT